MPAWVIAGLTRQQGQGKIRRYSFLLWGGAIKRHFSATEKILLLSPGIKTAARNIILSPDDLALFSGVQRLTASKNDQRMLSESFDKGGNGFAISIAPDSCILFSVRTVHCVCVALMADCFLSGIR